MLDRAARNMKRMREYRIRILSSLAVSLLLIWGGFRWWPLPQNEGPADINYDVRGQEFITMEEITQTKQETKKPPPPPPVHPVIVPDDILLEDIDLEFSDDFLALEDTGEDVEETTGTTVGDNMSIRADSGPKAVRIVQPEYSREARRRNIRAEVVIEVLVNERGQVTEVKVVGRYLLSKDLKEREAVALIGYGVEEAAEKAAAGWQFSPAREGGKMVRSYTRLTFSFGV